MTGLTPILQLTDFAYGDTTGNGYLNWGDMVDANFLTLENALGEVVNVALTGVDVTLTAAQEVSLIIQATGTLTANVNIKTSGRKGFWFVSNATTGAFTVTFKTTSGSGISVVQGGKALLYSDGTNIIALSHLSSTGLSLTSGATAAAMRTTLALVPGTDVQAYDATLAAIAAITTAADKLIYATGVDTFATADFTAVGRSIVAGATTAAVKTTLALNNVDNTADLAKPVSTAQQTALNLKADLASPALTGNPTAPTPTAGDNDTSIATTAFVSAAIATAALSIGPPNTIIEHQTATNVGAGSASAATWNTRPLTTKPRDVGTLVTLAANQFTPSVAMWVEWAAPASAVDGHQTRVYNVTDSLVAGYGSTAYSNSVNAGPDTSISMGGCALLAGKTYRLDHYTTTAYVNGLGLASNSGGTQIYARLQFWKA